MSFHVRPLLRSWRRDLPTLGAGALALGITLGASSAIIGFAWRIYFRPVQAPGLDRIVLFRALPDPIVQDPVAFWSQLKSVDPLSSFSTAELPLEQHDGPVRVAVSVVSAGLFEVFNVHPAMGRSFTQEDERNAAPEAILSYGFWKARLGATPWRAGLSIRLAGIPYGIVGVMPPNFNFPGATRLWILRNPGGRPPAVLRSSGWVARLREGVSREQLSAEAQAKLAYLNTTISPRTHVTCGESISAAPLTAFLAGDARPVVAELLTGVVLLALAAIANLTALFLSRAAARAKDFAIRVAMGASPGRVACEIVLEGLALAWCAAVVSLLAAPAAIWLLRRSILGDYVSLISGDAGIGVSVVAGSLILSTLAGLAISLLPAIGAARRDANKTLYGRGLLAAGNGRSIARRLLIAAEVALATSLLTLAGLAIASIQASSRILPGFATGNVVTAECDLSSLLSGRNALASRETAILAAAALNPSIASAGLVSAPPLTGAAERMLYLWHGNHGTSAAYFIASGDYFRTLRIPLVAGRAFVGGDRGVVIVNATLASRLWSGQDAIGKEIRFDGEDNPRQVVGVAGNVKATSVSDRDEPQIYLPYNFPYSHDLNPIVHLVARCRGACPSVPESLRSQVTAAASGSPVYDWSSYDGLLAQSAAPVKARAALLGAFALCAVTMAFVGIFALVSFSATRRTLEMGIRAAMGAGPLDMVSTLIAEGLTCTALGVVAGFVLAAASSAVMRGLFAGVSQFDPSIYARAAAILLVGAAAGSLFPSLRVARMKIADALRVDSE